MCSPKIRHIAESVCFEKGKCTVEDEVELAHVLEDMVERLDEDVDQVQDAELRLRAVCRPPGVQRATICDCEV